MPVTCKACKGEVNRHSFLSVCKCRPCCKCHLSPIDVYEAHIAALEAAQSEDTKRLDWLEELGLIKRTDIDAAMKAGGK